MSEFINGFGNDWNEAESYSGGDKPEPLKAGGYVLRILGAKIQHTSSGAAKIVFAFEIAEGERKDYFKQLHEWQKGFDENAKWQGTLDMFLPDKGDGSEEAQKKYKRSMKTLKSAVTAINENPSMGCTVVSINEWLKSEVADD